MDEFLQKDERSASLMAYSFMASIIALVLPLVLIPLVQVVGFSEVVEELAKFFIVFFIVFKMPSRVSKILLGILVGFLFGFSESMLYLTNIFSIGDPSLIIERFLLTVPMHMITVLVMVLFGLRYRTLSILGLVFAVAIHVAFNLVLIPLIV